MCAPHLPLLEELPPVEVEDPLGVRIHRAGRSSAATANPMPGSGAGTTRSAHIGFLPKSINEDFEHPLSDRELADAELREVPMIPVLRGQSRPPAP